MPGIRRTLQQFAAHLDGSDYHPGVRILRAGVKRQSVDLDAQFRREPEKILDRFRIAAEFARQIHLRVGTAKGNTNQYRAARAKLYELAQLVRIVDHETGEANTQGGA